MKHATWMWLALIAVGAGMWLHWYVGIAEARGIGAFFVVATDAPIEVIGIALRAAMCVTFGATLVTIVTVTVARGRRPMPMFAVSSAWIASAMGIAAMIALALAARTAAAIDARIAVGWLAMGGGTFAIWCDARAAMRIDQRALARIEQEIRRREGAIVIDALGA
jgi:hypothetical protein